jgi:hypothetical protein
MILISVLLLPFVCASESIGSLKFNCSWDNNAPVEIIVNPSNGSATRSDGGKPYEIIKLTDYVLWLSIVDPVNQMGLSTQMIQRAASTDGKSGKWIDVAHSVTGRVSSIDGGLTF